MSQTRLSICIAFVMFASLVAAQRIDPNKCNEQAQKLVNDYNKGMSGAIRNVVSRLSKHGSSSADIEGITAQADEIMDNLSEFANTENMTDANKLMSIGQKAMSGYMKLGSSIFKTQTLTEAIKIYSDFGMECAKLHSKFMTDMMTVCGPSTRCAINSQ